MKKILFFDFETTSLDVSKADIVEFGYIKTTEDLSIISSGSLLIKTSKEIDECIAKDVLKFDNDFLNEHGCEQSIAFCEMSKIFQDCDYLVAHNGLSFDIPIAKKFLGEDLFKEKTIVDTMLDLPDDFYTQLPTKKLKYLAIERGIFLRHTHRTIKDVTILHSLLESFKDILDTIFYKASKKIYLCKIDVAFADRDKAKQIGGRWNAEEKIWQKDFNEDDYKDHIENGWPLKILSTIR